MWRLIGILLYLAAMGTTSWVAVQAEVARPPTLAQYVIALDWSSAGVAMLLALTGGAVRTAVTLFNPDKVVGHALRETFKDAIVALLTGLAIFMLLAGMATVWAPLHPAVQALGIFLAGMARGRFLASLDALIGKVMDLLADGALAWAKSKVPTSTPPEGKP